MKTMITQNTASTTRTARGTTPKLSKKRIDMGKISVVVLPRRNDELYMRGLRRRRA